MPVSMHPEKKRAAQLLHAPCGTDADRRTARTESKAQPKEKARRIVPKAHLSAQTLWSVVYAAFGLLLGCAPLPLGLYPCGTALILAAPTGRYAFFAYIGAVIALFFGGSASFAEAGAFFAVNTLTLFCTFLFMPKRKQQKMLLALVISAVCGLIMAATGGFAPEYLLRGAVYAIGLSAACACLCAVSRLRDPAAASPKAPGRHSLVLDAGFCAGAYLFVYALSFVPTSVFFPALSAGALITLFAAKSGGALYGLLLGLVCGVAAEAPGILSAAAAPLGIAGFTAGCVGTPTSGSIGRTNLSACIAFSGAFTVSALFFGTAQVYYAVCSVLAAAALFVPIAEFFPRLVVCRRFPKQLRPLPEKNDFEKLSGTFTALSEMIYRLSDKLRYPSDAEIRELAAKTLDTFCSGCTKGIDVGEKCAGRRLYESENIADIISQRLSAGGLKKSDLPDRYAEHCIRLSEMVEQLNEAYAALVSDRFRENKTEILASEYSAMARLIKYTSQKTKIDKTPDLALTEAANAALAAIGLRYTTLEAYGDRMKTIEVHGVSLDQFPCTSEELASYLSEKCGYLFDSPEYLGLGAKTTMRLKRKRKLKLEYARSARAKGGGATNGDSVSFFESDEDYFYALISDGMGSGRSAALTSRLTSVFIEKLLTTGAHKNVTLELLNNLLLSKNDESFATVDLLEIDLLTGDAAFIKAGAAPAYIIRAAKLYKIASYTPPAGIIRSFSAESTRFSLEKGDTVLMLYLVCVR